MSCSSAAENGLLLKTEQIVALLCHGLQVFEQSPPVMTALQIQDLIQAIQVSQLKYVHTDCRNCGVEPCGPLERNAPYQKHLRCSVW